MLRSNILLTFHSGAISCQGWIFFHFASLGNCSLHPIVTAVCAIPTRLISSHLMLCLLSFSHLISSHLSSSPPFPVDHHCPHLFSCHLSFSHLILAHPTSSLFNSSQLLHSMQLASTQFFSAPHRSSHVRYVRSSQLTPSHLISSHLSFFSLLNSSQLMSAHLIHLLSSPQLFSALVSSSHLSSALLSALSDHLNSCPAQNLLQNQVSAPKQKKVLSKLW